MLALRFGVHSRMRRAGAATLEASRWRMSSAPSIATAHCMWLSPPHICRRVSRGRFHHETFANGSAHWSKFMTLKWLTKAPMECSSARALKTAPRSKSGIRWALIALVVTIAWREPVRADDVLDRGARFHIPASPLASALVEFSTQSGIQVAAADATVSNLNSDALNGTYSIHAALSALLHGTGLEFSRVGIQTVAIRRVSVGPNSQARADGTGVVAKMPSPESAESHPRDDASAAPEIPDVTVTAPRPPTDQELAGNSLEEFILHHATTHYVNTSTMGNLARWRGGMQSICPLTVGLTPGYNAFVTARLRALAAYVGAPVDSNPHCKNNVNILFTDMPQERMDIVMKWATVYFRNRYSGGMRNLIAFRSDHAIQGWYMTTRGGAIVLNSDVGLVGLNVLPVWPQITQNYIGSNSLGTRLGGGSGSGSGIGIVILVVDTTKVVGYAIGATADYLAMLTLSVAQSPDHCDPLPSILDLLSSSCGAREMPTAITVGDLAFLKALYYKNTGLGESLSRAEINANMMRQFRTGQ
jgi:hypothetical protein